jgi:hypothetical protein
MRSRSLLIATLVAGVVLFVWQSISHGALGLPEKGMRPFADSTAAGARAIRALAPQNGVFFSPYGVFAAVDVSADYRDKTKQFGSMMAKQIVLDFAVVFVLALLLDRLGDPSVLRTGATYATLGLAFGVLMFVSNWIWWNFPAAWTLGNVVDQVIGLFLVGVTLGWVQRRFGEPTVETAERPGVPAQGGLPTSAGATVKR